MAPGLSTVEVARRRVPAVVVGSSVLLALSGLTRLGQVAAEAVNQDAYLRAHEAAGTPTGFGAPPIVFLMGVALVVSLVALIIAVLAFVNLRGRNWTRIATWIVGGVTLAVAACWLALGLILSPPGEVPEVTNSVNAIAAELMPDWVEPVSTITGYVASPALLVALILLALPPANAFYRRHHPVSEQPLFPGDTIQWS